MVRGRGATRQARGAQAPVAMLALTALLSACGGSGGGNGEQDAGGGADAGGGVDAGTSADGGAVSDGGALAAPVDLTYATAAPVYVRGRAITDNAPSSSGGAPSSYTVSPALPAGLSLSSATGVLSGTPTALAAPADYTVTATNAAGSTSAVLRLTVADVPRVDYSASSGTAGTYGQAMAVSPSALEANHQPVLSCALAADAPALPAGLALDAATCAITGTPTEVRGATSYRVVATNAVGPSAPADVTLSVAPDRPSLDYGAAGGTIGSVGTPMRVEPVLASNGSAVTACATKLLTPALPAGLSVDAQSCVISGTPEVPVDAVTFTLVATNAAGASADAAVTITVVAAVPRLSFPAPGPAPLRAGAALELVPVLAANGAPVTACAVAPPLPRGLSLSATTCVISGTPDASLPSTVHAVRARNAVGESPPAEVTLHILDVPLLSYAGAAGTAGTVGTAMTVRPSVLLPNEAPVTACAVKPGTPPLPAELSVAAETCVISGTPIALLAETSFTLRAANAAGTSAEAVVVLSVRAGLPRLSYGGSASASGRYGQALTPLAPTVLEANGAAITDCVASPTLPAGLSVTAPSCILSGTPLATLATTTFAIAARSSAGSSTDAYVTLRVDASPPALSYAGTSGSTALTAGVAASIPPGSLALNGGALTGCAVKLGTPALPAGLSVDPSTCTISGTPTAAAASATYTVVASNSGGASADATVTLAVAAGRPALSYAGAANTAGVTGQPMSVAPTRLATNGGALTGCAVKSGTPALPSPLVIESSTCVISGTPTAVLAPTLFTVVAENAAGSSDDATVTLSVAAAPSKPTLSYAAVTGALLRRGVAVTLRPSTFEANGSTVTACAVQAGALPAGLSISSDCVVSGTPTALGATSGLTIAATNGAGTSDAAPLSLLVADVPTLSFDGAGGMSGRVGVALSVVPSTFLPNESPVTSCGLAAGSPPLPSELGVDATTCALTGTPTAPLAATTFTLVARNAVGPSSEATVSLRVDPSAPSLSYAGAEGTSGTYGRALRVAPTALETNGAAVTGCATSPSLPQGLSIDPTSCVVSGTPTAVAAASDYAVVATNAAGASAAASLRLGVAADVPTLSFEGARGTDVTYGAALAVAPSLLLANGAEVTGCALANGSAALPSGLSIAATTCVVSGTPLAAVTARTVSIVASSAAGTSSPATLTLTVRALPPVLSFASVSSTTLRVGVQALVEPSSFDSGGEAPRACEVSPALPSGLTADPASRCAIRGTPTAFAAAADYAITAVNSAGSSSPATVRLTVEDVPALSYGQAVHLEGVVGQAVTALRPASLTGNGSTVTGCSVTPALPAGLSLSADCVVSGTPTVAWRRTTHEVRARSAVGDSEPAAVDVTVRAPAALALSEGPTYDFGAWGVGATGEHVFELSNAGDLPATSLDGTASLGDGFTHKGGTFPGRGGTCGASLPGGASCLVVVRFAPQSARAYAGALSVAYHDGLAARSATRALAGTGVDTAQLAVTDFPPLYYTGYGLAADGPVHDFGVTGIGRRIEHTFSVTNNGLAAATGLAGTISVTTGSAASFGFAGGAFPGSGGTCGSGALQAGQSCLVVLAYTAESGASAGSFSVTYGGGASPGASATRALAGSGTTGPALSLRDYRADSEGAGLDIGPVFDFGVTGVGRSATHDFYVFNGGASTATALAAGAMPPGFDYPGGFPGAAPGERSDLGGDVPFCSTELRAGAGCAVRVRFAPTVAQSYTGSVAVAFGPGGASSAARAVKGVGTPFALLRIQDDGGDQGLVFEYGLRPVGGATTALFVVTNEGASAATALTPGTLATGFRFTESSFPGGAGTVVTQRGDTVPFCAAGGSLAAGAACAVRVDLSSSTPGGYATDLSLTYADASSPPVAKTVVRALQGRLTDQAIVRVSCPRCGDWRPDPVLDFGLVPVGTTRDAWVVVTNQGAATSALSAGDGALTGAGFSFADGSFPGGSGTADVDGEAMPFCGPAPYGLAPGQRCAVKLRYTAPAGDAVVAGQLTLTTGTATAATASLPLAAQATTKAVVSLARCWDCGGDGSALPSYDFGEVAKGRSRSAFFVLSNTGASSTTVTATGFSSAQSPFSFAGGTYPGGTPGAPVQVDGRDTQYCPASGASLAAGARCVIQVIYAASGSTPQQDAFSLSLTDATSASVGYQLFGTPTDAAIVTVSTCPGCGAPGDRQPGYDFGVRAANSQGTAYLFVENTGNASATLTLGGVSGPFGFGTSGYPGGTPGATVDIWGQPRRRCPVSGGTLASGELCVLELTYSPSGNGPQQGTLSLTFGGATRPGETWMLAGSSTTAAILSVDECEWCWSGGGGGGGSRAYDFGTTAQGDVRENFFFVRNSGVSPGTLAGIAVGGAAFAFGFDAGNGAPLPFPGGTAGATVEVNGRQQTLCPALGGTLAGGATCVFRVAYKASGTGEQVGSLAFSFGPTDVFEGGGFTLRGTSTTLAILSLTDCITCGGGPSGGDGVPRHDFGTVRSGDTFTQYLWLRNTGASPASVTAASFGGPSAAAFRFAGSGYPGGTAGATVNVWGQDYQRCPALAAQLGARSACVLEVVYASSGTSPQEARLALTVTGATATTAAMDFTAAPTNAAIVEIGDCATCSQGWGTFEFGVAGIAIDKLFVVHNAGKSTAQLAAGAPLEAPFSFASGAYPGGAGSESLDGQSLAYCGASLAADGRCVVKVRFSGAGAPLGASGALTLALGGASAPTATRALSATSTTRALLTVDDGPPSWFPCSDGACPPVELGTVAVGDWRDRTLVVSNRGAVTTTVVSGQVDQPAFFLFSNGTYPGGTDSVSPWGGASLPHCSAIAIAPGSQCLISVRFDPMDAAPSVSSAVRLTYSDAAGPVGTAVRSLHASATTGLW